MSSTTPFATKLMLVVTLVVTTAALAAFVAGRSDEQIETAFAAPFLWLFSALFLLRVAGQLLVRLRRPSWLPPTEEWNLSPYKLLLPSQLAILGLLVWIDGSFSAGSGPPVHARPSLGDVLLVVSYAYAAAMAVRYAVRMRRRPGERWFGGTIPIVFHEVLAAYLYVLGAFHASS